MANQICEALKSVHPKQTLQKSAGKVLEGPCGLDEPWVWTALRDFGQLDRHHMDGLQRFQPACTPYQHLHTFYSDKRVVYLCTSWQSADTFMNDLDPRHNTEI